MTKVLLVDLNNFARYPTLPIGMLASTCRGAGLDVRVFSPMSLDISGVDREPIPSRVSLALTKLNHRAMTSASPALHAIRRHAAQLYRMPIRRHESRLMRAFIETVRMERPDVILISTYLAYRNLVESMGAHCVELDVPMIVGGPYFAQPEVIEAWISIPGMTVLACGELELEIPTIIERVLHDDVPTDIPGVITRIGQETRGVVAPPLTDLDRVPFPDYDDFDWPDESDRIVPVITGRGCAWGACSFCSDVTSTAGRTFRSRSASNVLDEIAHLHQKYGAGRFVFTDLKLNGDLDVWNAILDRMQEVAPGARWIASVHLGRRKGGSSGLDRAALERAASSGCVRLTTGLETGSAALIERMRKGTTPERLSRYLRDATDCGISTRCTMIAGFPGEGVEDVERSLEFLRDHESCIERVSLNPYRIITGTPDHRALVRRRLPDVEGGSAVHALAVVDHEHTMTRDRTYRKAISRLFDAAHRINRKPMLERARGFEGVM